MKFVQGKPGVPGFRQGETPHRGPDRSQADHTGLAKPRAVTSVPPAVAGGSVDRPAGPARLKPQSVGPAGLDDQTGSDPPPSRGYYMPALRALSRPEAMSVFGGNNKRLDHLSLLSAHQDVVTRLSKIVQLG